MRKAATLIEVLTILAIIAVLAALLLPGSDFDMTHRYPPPTLDGDVKDLTDIAGEYCRGSGRGFRHRLNILPDGRYSLISSGCTGVHRREFGFVAQAGDQCVLLPVERSGLTVKSKLVLVRWGQRYYLISPDEMQKFPEAIVQGKEPRNDMNGHFYIRLPIASAYGLPNSQPNLRNELLNGLVLGRVSNVSGIGLAKIGRVEVNLGAKDGIAEGMILRVRRGGGSLATGFRVNSVADHTCVATEFLPSSDERPLDVGMEVIAIRDKGGT